jgi:hypothetical protein
MLSLSYDRSSTRVRFFIVCSYKYVTDYLLLTLFLILLLLLFNFLFFLLYIYVLFFLLLYFILFFILVLACNGVSVAVKHFNKLIELFWEELTT